MLPLNKNPGSILEWDSLGYHVSLLSILFKWQFILGSNHFGFLVYSCMLLWLVDRSLKLKFWYLLMQISVLLLIHLCEVGHMSFSLTLKIMYWRFYICRLIVWTLLLKLGYLIASKGIFRSENDTYLLNSVFLLTLIYLPTRLLIKKWHLIMFQQVFLLLFVCNNF